MTAHIHCKSWSKIADAQTELSMKQLDVNKNVTVNAVFLPMK